jgi:uncharacterized membrane protein YdjX (TVP38/TMEM64 family)
MRAPRWLQVLLGLLWLALGLSAVVFWWFSEVPLLEVPELLSRRLDEFGLMPALLLVLALYTFRPLILFPSTVMGVASGMAFGPLLGSAVTMAGELLGAALAFAVTRVLGRRWVSTHESARLARWDRRLSRHGILTVTIMRLILLPFDSVSFFCGLTGVRPRDFLVGTMLGGGCYIIGITLLGGSASIDLTGELSIAGVTLSRRVWVLILSGCSFAVGLLLAWRLRGLYREEGEQPQATDKDAPVA